MNASSVMPSATDDAGKYLAMALVVSVLAATVPDGFSHHSRAGGLSVGRTVRLHPPGREQAHIDIRILIRPQLRLIDGLYQDLSLSNLDL